MFYLQFALPLHRFIYINKYSILNIRIWFKNRQKLQKQHALKGQKLQKQYALKGQKLLAQGNALGIIAVNKAPCKGKSFVYLLVLESFCPYRAADLHPYPQGDALG